MAAPRVQAGLEAGLLRNQNGIFRAKFERPLCDPSYHRVNGLAKFLGQKLFQFPAGRRIGDDLSVPYGDEASFVDCQ